MTASFDYDRGSEPPAPTIMVRIGSPGEDDRVQLGALADTGADITIVPVGVAERVLAVIGAITVQSFDGESHQAPLYRAAIEIDGVVDVLEVVGWREDAIIGRDVLNRWVATFDGPRSVLTLAR